MTSMEKIGDFLDLLSRVKFDRTAFLEQQKTPFLVTVEVMDDVLPGGMTPEGAAAPTVAQDPAKLRRASMAAREAGVYSIVKREGANKEKEILVGRSRDNDVWINDPEVSKHHVKLHAVKGGWQVVDLGSTNGTFVNDKRIETNKATPLNSYDAVRLGRAAKMQFLDPESFFEYLSVLRRFVGM